MTMRMNRLIVYDDLIYDDLIYDDLIYDDLIYDDLIYDYYKKKNYSQHGSQ